MAASRDRLFNSPRVRAALHLGQVTPLSPPLTQPWGWEKGESCLALRQQQQAAEIKELKIWGNDFKASAKRWHDETTKTIIGISKVCTPLRNIFHLKNFTLMRVLQSSAALLKAACVFSWLRPNGILPWLSESGKQSSHWGSRPCGHSCGTDPLSLLWLRSSHGLLWSGSLRCPRQPDSTENSASPLVAGSSSWMPHVQCFVSDLHAEIFFLFVCCETCLALFCNH